MRESTEAKLKNVKIKKSTDENSVLFLHPIYLKKRSKNKENAWYDGLNKVLF